MGSQPLYIAAFYKPKEDDQDNLGMLRNSLDKLIGKKGNIMVIGDFNLQKFTLTASHLSNRTVLVGQCMAVLRKYLTITTCFKWSRNRLDLTMY